RPCASDLRPSTARAALVHRPRRRISRLALHAAPTFGPRPLVRRWCIARAEGSPAWLFMRLRPSALDRSYGFGASPGPKDLPPGSQFLHPPEQAVGLLGRPGADLSGVDSRRTARVEHHLAVDLDAHRVHTRR